MILMGWGKRAVHHDFDGVGEADVAHVLRLLNGRQRVEHAGLQNTVTRIGVDGEVTHAKRGEVLEEVRALRGIYVVVLQSGLHDDACCGDVRPLHGDAQPVVARTPTARADQDVVLSLIQELAVDLLYFHRYLWIVGGGEVVVGLHIHHIYHVLGDAVTQRVVAAQQAVGVGNLVQILFQHLLGVDDRTNLKEVEPTPYPSRTGGDT